MNIVALAYKLNRSVNFKTAQINCLEELVLEILATGFPYGKNRGYTLLVYLTKF
jgi:hypothetical protein